MRILSFAKTVDGLMQRRKTVTRRSWTDRYAKSIHAGDVLAAWDRLPHVRGARHIGIIKVTCDPYQERLSDITLSEIEAEGLTVPLSPAETFAQRYGSPQDTLVWVIRFKVLWVAGEPISLDRMLAWCGTE